MQEDMTKGGVSKRSARARMRDSRSSTIYIREFAPLISDESAHGGGNDSGPTPLEYVLGGLCA